MPDRLKSMFSERTEWIQKDFVEVILANFNIKSRRSIFFDNNKRFQNFIISRLGLLYILANSQKGGGTIFQNFYTLCGSTTVLTSQTAMGRLLMRRKLGT